MTDNEIVIALRAVAEKYKEKFVATCETNISAMATDAADHIERLCEEINCQKAELDELKKKDNEWALSYANSVARGIRKKEEAIKEFEKKAEEALAPTVSILFHISETLTEANKQHISPEEALKNIRVQLSEKQPICSKLQLEEILDKCAKEMED